MKRVAGSDVFVLPTVGMLGATRRDKVFMINIKKRAKLIQQAAEPYRIKPLPLVELAKTLNKGGVHVSD